MLQKVNANAGHSLRTTDSGGRKRGDTSIPSPVLALSAPTDGIRHTTKQTDRNSSPCTWASMHTNVTRSHALNRYAHESLSISCLAKALLSEPGFSQLAFVGRNIVFFCYIFKLNFIDYTKLLVVSLPD